MPRERAARVALHAEPSPDLPRVVGRRDARAAARRLTPAQSLVLGFSAIALAGAMLLTLPACSAEASGTSFVDALFTSASAVTTTGLVVVDTGSHYSLLGQTVVLLLIQVGGLGYMVFVASLAYVAGRRITLATRMRLADSLVGAQPDELRRFTADVLAYTLAFELAGTVAFALHWWGEFPLGRAIYLGLFHSVSAFCTAGFGLFPDSLTAWRDSVALNITVAVVATAGGIGFFVLREAADAVSALRHHRRPRPLSTHTRIVLGFSAALVLGGTAFLWAVDPVLRGLPPDSGLCAATFQAISAATTTGFNTVDIGSLAPASHFLVVLLMFVGASPGGTGGGIKTTVVGLLLAATVASFNGSDEALVKGRRIPLDVLYRGVAVAFLGALVVALTTALLALTERASFLSLLFEATSAFGTVGLSMGVTPQLSTIGKLAVCVTMLVGRVGPLAVGFALMGRRRPSLPRHPRGRVWVG